MKPFTARTLHPTHHVVKVVSLVGVVLGLGLGLSLLRDLRSPPATAVRPRTLRLLAEHERARDFPGEAAVHLGDTRVDWQRAPFDTVLGQAVPGYNETSPGVWQRPVPWQLADAYNGWEVTHTTEEPRTCCRTRDSVGLCRCSQGPTVGVTLRDGPRGLYADVGIGAFQKGNVTLTVLAPNTPLVAELTSDGAPVSVWLSRNGVQVSGTTPCVLEAAAGTGAVTVGADASPAGVRVLMTAEKEQAHE